MVRSATCLKSKSHSEKDIQDDQKDLGCYLPYFLFSHILVNYSKVNLMFVYSTDVATLMRNVVITSLENHTGRNSSNV